MLSCPDDGTCHHECHLSCFRVKYAGPLSGVYPNDTWPESIATAYNREKRDDRLQQMIDRLEQQ